MSRKNTKKIFNEKEKKKQLTLFNQYIKDNTLYEVGLKTAMKYFKSLERDFSIDELPTNYTTIKKDIIKFYTYPTHNRS